MEVYISRQLVTLLCSLALGVCFGISWDIVRITRVLLGVKYRGNAADKLYDIKLPLLKEKKSNNRAAISRFLNTLIFIQDFFSFAIWGIASAVFFYYFSDGHWRLFALLGMFSGFLAYYFTFGRAVIYFSQYIAFALKAAVRYIFFFVSYPIRLLFRYIKTAFCVIYRAMRSKLEYIHNEIRISAFDRRVKRCIIKMAEADGFDPHERNYKNAQKSDNKNTLRGNRNNRNRCNNTDAVSSKPA